MFGENYIIWRGRRVLQGIKKWTFLLFKNFENFFTGVFQNHRFLWGWKMENRVEYWKFRNFDWMTNKFPLKVSNFQYSSIFIMPKYSDSHLKGDFSGGRNLRKAHKKRSAGETLNYQKFYFGFSVLSDWVGWPLPLCFCWPRIVVT